MASEFFLARLRATRQGRALQDYRAGWEAAFGAGARTEVTMEDKPHPGTSKELYEALHVAACAECVVRQIVESGKPSADSFIGLCVGLRDLEMNIIGGGDISTRADEIWDGMRDGFRELTKEPEGC